MLPLPPPPPLRRRQRPRDQKNLCRVGVVNEMRLAPVPAAAMLVLLPIESEVYANCEGDDDENDAGGDDDIQSSSVQENGDDYIVMMMMMMRAVAAVEAAQVQNG